MKTTIHNKAFSSYDLNDLNGLNDLKEVNFASPVNGYSLNKSNTNISNFSIELTGDTPLYAYADIGGRILDCRIVENEGKQFVEFSVKTTDLDNLDSLILYLISKDESEYCRIKFDLN